MLRQAVDVRRHAGKRSDCVEKEYRVLPDSAPHPVHPQVATRGELTTRK